MDTKQHEKRLSFVLYQEEKSPQYFEIKRNFLKFLFFAFPITLLLLIFFIVVGTLYLRKVKSLALETPMAKTISANRNMENEYLNQIQALEAKLIKPAEGLSSLGLFKQIKGQLDLSKKTILSVEGLASDYSEGKTRLQFALSNDDSSRKIAGYLFAIIKNNNSIRIFPENAILENDFQASYNKGEKFSFNRLRPFMVTLNDGKPYKNINFKILVFSLTGDLLLDKNYSIGKN
jgi:hypothetical protein